MSGVSGSFCSKWNTESYFRVRSRSSAVSRDCSLTKLVSLEEVLARRLSVIGWAERHVSGGMLEGRLYSFELGVHHLQWPRPHQ